MGRKCFVPFCTSGYDSNKNKISLFSVPKDINTLEKWRRQIPRKDRILSVKDFVCEKHFSEKDIIRTWNDEINTIHLRHCRLKLNATPSIFPKCPQKKTKFTKKRRIINKVLPLDSTQPVIKKEKNTTETSDLPAPTTSEHELEQVIVECNYEEQDPLFIPVIKKEKTTTETSDQYAPTTNENEHEQIIVANNYEEQVPLFIPVIKKEKTIAETSDHHASTTSEPEYEQNNYEEDSVFSSLWKSGIEVPDLWSLNKTRSGTNKFLIVTKYVMLQIGHPFPEKQIVLNENCNLTYIILDKIIQPLNDKLKITIDCVEEFKNILNIFDSLYLCKGGPTTELYNEEIYSRHAYIDKKFNIWRHEKCSIFVENINKRCEYCRVISKNLSAQRNRTDKKKLNNSTNTHFNKKNSKLVIYNQERKIKRLNTRIDILKSVISSFKHKIKNIDISSLETQLKELDELDIPQQ